MHVNPSGLSDAQAWEMLRLRGSSIPWASPQNLNECITETLVLCMIEVISYIRILKVTRRVIAWGSPTWPKMRIPPYPTMISTLNRG